MADTPNGTVTWVIRKIADGMAQLVYREIDINVPPSADTDGAVLAVSNHFGGLSDGVLILDALPRMPRVVARDVIWRIPVVGPIATAAGGIPIHRRADGGKTSNDESFASCYQALVDEELVLIFPEGVTQDVPHMAEVKTGAARIALGARASGATGIAIQPIGLHYEDKAGFRSRALVKLGDAIDLDAWVNSYGPTEEPVSADHHDAVHALTDEIDVRMRRAAPDYPDWQAAQHLEDAANVVLHDVDHSARPLRYGNTALLASHLNRTDPSIRSRIADQASRYRQELTEHGTRDLAVARASSQRAPNTSRSWVWDLIVAVVLLPYAAIGALINLLPWLVVRASRLLPGSPAVKATITPAIALMVFTAEWAFLTWRAAETYDWKASVMALLFIPLFSASTILVVERFVMLRRRLKARRIPRGVDLDRLATTRGQLSDDVWEAL